MLPVKAGLGPTPPFSSRFLKQMLLRTSLRNSGSRWEVLYWFQRWQDTPRREHSKSLAIRCHKVCVQKTVPFGIYTWGQNRLLSWWCKVFLSCLPCHLHFYRGVRFPWFLSRKESQLSSFTCYFDSYGAFQHMFLLGKPAKSTELQQNWSPEFVVVESNSVGRILLQLNSSVQSKTGPGLLIPFLCF